MSNPTIQSIYAAGITFPATAPYDPTKQQKTWVRALQAGEDPTDVFVFETAVVDNTVPAPYVTWHQKGISKGDAAVANIPPAGYVPPPGVTPVTGAVPSPMDQTLIPAGFTLTGEPFGLIFVSNAPTPATPAQTTEAAQVTEILEGIQEIEQAGGLPVK